MQPVIDFLAEIPSSIFLWALLGIPLLGKVYYRFVKNKIIWKREVKDPICPLCQTSLDRFDANERCEHLLEKETRQVARINCGYLGEMNRYSKSNEFASTFLFLFFGTFMFGAFIYYFWGRTVRTCPRCTRVKRRNDFRQLLRASIRD